MGILINRVIFSVGQPFYNPITCRVFSTSSKFFRRLLSRPCASTRNQSCVGLLPQRNNMTSAPKKPDVAYTTRSMRPEDIPQLHALLYANKWNMEQDYLSCTFSTDPSCLVVTVDQDNQLIGHHGVQIHSDYLASAGMNIVKEGYRHLGIGRDMFHYVMDRVADRNVGGTALTERITFYEQFGWTIPSFTLTYNQGPVNPEFLAVPSNATDVEIVPTNEVVFKDVVNYDAGLNTLPRKRFLNNWINHERAKSHVAVRKGRIVGYSVLRPADVGWKMYPLYADDKQIAHALFVQTVKHIPQGDVLVFTQPIENPDATAIVNGNKLTPYVSMTRLYNKWPVTVDIQRVYSVSSTEYGIV